jgi:hypothetical protein
MFYFGVIKKSHSANAKWVAILFDILGKNPLEGSLLENTEDFSFFLTHIDKIGQ